MGNGPIVRSVKIPKIIKAGVEVQAGLAENQSMVRVDVYTKNNKFYLVPIYVADMIKDELPNRAIVANKSEDEWDIVDDTYEFKFSLRKNDLVEIKQKSSKTTEEKAILGYYISTHRRTGAIKIMSPDGSLEFEFGTKTLKSFEKYEVGILGDYHKITKEKRMGTIKNNHKRKNQKS